MKELLMTNFGAITKRTIDDSYVITRGAMPYHVPNQGEFAGLWKEVNAYALANPDKVTLEYPPPPPTPDELEASFSEAVTARLNAFAQAKGYDSILSARLASNSYEADGEAARQAWSDTWDAAIALMPQVRSGALTAQQAIAQLPALVWPE
jgi:hypothetical protein